MRRARLAVAAIAALAALAFTSTALAAFAPKITIAAATGGGTNVRVAAAATDDPTARFALYAPLGTTGSFTAAPGTSLGKVTAHAQAADLGGAVLPLTGDVLVANPIDPAIVAASNACDPVAHATILVLSLQAAGQMLNIPLFVDASEVPEAAFSSFKLIVCLPPPDLPAGTPGRATFGAKLLDADFAISALVGPAAAGEQRWRSLWTPYVPQQGTPNAAGTVETQSVVRRPTLLLIGGKTVAQKKKVRVKGKLVTKTTTKATIAAALSEAQKGIGGITVTFLESLQPTGSFKRTAAFKTDADGLVGIVGTLTKTAYFKVTAVVPERDLGAAGCTATFAPVPCIGATVAGQTLTSKTIKLALRR
jgi:hypothetical protein